MITDFEKALGVLIEADVTFMVVGGVAAALHGSSRMTQDLDIVYSRDEVNLQRIVDALQAYSPYLRGAPSGLPFLWDLQTLNNSINLTLSTSFGALDLLGEITGGGAYEDLVDDSIDVEGFGFQFKILDLEKLIVVKRAAGRPKDLEAISELQDILRNRLKATGQ